MNNEDKHIIWINNKLDPNATVEQREDGVFLSSKYGEAYLRFDAYDTLGGLIGAIIRSGKWSAEWEWERYYTTPRGEEWCFFAPSIFPREYKNSLKDMLPKVSIRGCDGGPYHSPKGEKAKE